MSSPEKILTPFSAITILSLSNISIDDASNFNSSEKALRKFKKNIKKNENYKINLFFINPYQIDH